VVFVTGLLGRWAGGAARRAACAEHPALLVASGALLFVEFFADKIPGVDSVWDLLQRDPHPGGRGAGGRRLRRRQRHHGHHGGPDGRHAGPTSQAAKTTTRAAINTSPEPFSNVGASLVEDGASVGAIWLALTHRWPSPPCCWSW
jgi:hypothetical protein